MISNELSVLGVSTFSLCLNSSTGDVALTQPVRGPQAGDPDPAASSAFRFFFDIEMLRKSKLFFGLFDSNIARMVHRLRSPRWTASYAIATETYPDERRNLNHRLDDLPLSKFIGE